MFLPSDLTKEQQQAAHDAVEYALTRMASEDMEPEHAAAVLIGAAWQALDHKSQPGDSAAFIRGLLDDMQSGIPARH